jgi:hypothetical protein
MKPAIGSRVVYQLSQYDADEINRRREDFAAFNRANRSSVTEPGFPGRSGHIGHFGNPASEGDVYPADVVRTFGGSTANLQVHLDGNDTYWATSRAQGDGHAQWSWPQPPERESGDRPARF